MAVTPSFAVIILRSPRRNFFGFGGNLPNLSSLKTHHEKYIIGHSRDQMYQVVANVSDYKTFLPWCRDSLFINEGNVDSKHAEAVLDIGYPPFIERYTSILSMERPSLVRAVCKNGRLFKHLETAWRFGDVRTKDTKQFVPGSCTLEYQLRFESSTSIVTAAVNSMLFDAVAKEMVHAFLKRAAQLYGPPSRPPIRLLSS